MSVFQLRGTPAQQAAVQKALNRCSFEFAKLRPRMERKGVPAIAIRWDDFSDWRRRGYSFMPWGTASHDGTLTINAMFAQRPERVAEIVLAEIAHAVDHYWLTRDDRRALLLAYHDGDPNKHPGETWRYADRSDPAFFRKTAHEAWMLTFQLATSDVKPAITDFRHRSTPAVIQLARKILARPVGETQPAPVTFTKAELDAAVAAAREDAEAEAEAAMEAFRERMRAALLDSLEVVVGAVDDA